MIKRMVAALKEMLVGREQPFEAQREAPKLSYERAQEFRAEALRRGLIYINAVPRDGRYFAFYMNNGDIGTKADAAVVREVVELAFAYASEADCGEHGALLCSVASSADLADVFAALNGYVYWDWASRSQAKHDVVTLAQWLADNGQSPTLANPTSV